MASDKDKEKTVADLRGLAQNNRNQGEKAKAARIDKIADAIESDSEIDADEAQGIMVDVRNDNFKDAEAKAANHGALP